ncbi:SDR family oxidoreductase [Paraburkholderia ultramafica]|uniref:SDR family oxidoreductase n=1 Tax=Paraburkholderia ultramafica TaxID=1544867 RepID=UPI0015834E71|nr:SDR family oxidoreductase [Paraburkholderia ultramafica]
MAGALTQIIGFRERQVPVLLQHLQHRLLNKRSASPEEFAEICAFLVSSKSSILTGTAIATDAGSRIVGVPTLRL